MSAVRKDKAGLSRGLKKFHDAGTNYSAYHSLYLTKGVHYLATHGDCWWLLDMINDVQHITLNWRRAQCRLQVREDRSARFEVFGDEGKLLHSDTISYTDFVLNEITLVVAAKIVMLSTEDL